MLQEQSTLITVRVQDVCIYSNQTRETKEKWIGTRKALGLFRLRLIQLCLKKKKKIQEGELSKFT